MSKKKLYNDCLQSNNYMVEANVGMGQMITGDFIALRGNEGLISNKGGKRWVNLDKIHGFDVTAVHIIVHIRSAGSDNGNSGVVEQLAKNFAYVKVTKPGCTLSYWMPIGLLEVVSYNGQKIVKILKHDRVKRSAAIRQMNNM